MCGVAQESEYIAINYSKRGGLLEATAQVFRGDTEGLFRSYRRNDVSTVGHLRGYGDLSESTNLDLGVWGRAQQPLER